MGAEAPSKPGAKPSEEIAKNYFDSLWALRRTVSWNVRRVRNAEIFTEIARDINCRIWIREACIKKVYASFDAPKEVVRAPR